MTFFKLLPLLLTVIGANPIYIGTPLPLEHYPSANFHHLTQASALINQPLANLYQLGSLDQLTKGLLTSHISGQIPKGLPMPIVHPAAALALASPEISFPIKKDMIFPEKKIAGALIKQVPKVSKLPISVLFSPKALELSSIAQAGILGEGLAGASALADKSFLNNLGLSYGF